MAGFASYTARSAMRPDIDAGPMDRKCRESNGPVPAELASGASPAPPNSDGPPTMANRATSGKKRRSGLMMRQIISLRLRGADFAQEVSAENALVDERA